MEVLTKDVEIWKSNAKAEALEREVAELGAYVIDRHKGTQVSPCPGRNTMPPRALVRSETKHLYPCGVCAIGRHKWVWASPFPYINTISSRSLVGLKTTQNA
ncbi:hypothetical protein V6N12_045860 [Hibiscus sabdariffa]|uniref:Uncharacterized protein n=1 Tax=Hibiscus sabdariffa TaxID=183260 RepID=A0ABR2G442_9ROSI